MGYRKTLPEGTAEALESRLRQSKERDEFRRVQCVYLRARYGYDAQQIAQITGYAVGTVQNIHTQYLARGESIFDLGRPGGRHAAHQTPQEEAAFLERLIAPGDAGGLLEVGPIHKAHCEVVGREVALSTTYRLLHRQGWRKIVPRPRHPKADEPAQEAFKKMAATGRASD